MFIPMLLLYLLAGGIFVAITIENLTTSVHLTLFGLQTPELPVGLLILLAFLAGALLLYVAAFLSARNDKSSLNTLRRRVSELEQQQAMQQGSVPAPSPMSQLRPNTANLQMPGMFTPPKY